MDMKIVAVSVVAVLVIAGVGGAIILSPNNGNDNFEYDSEKGWYSWDPIVHKFASGRVGLSPYMMDTVEEMYTAIYGQAPDYSKYTMADVPEDFLAYESSVLAETETTVSVMSHIRISSSVSQWANVPVTIEKEPDHLLCAGSTAAFLYLVLQESMTAEQAEAKVWEYVWGLDKSAFEDESGSAHVSQYGLTIPTDKVTKLPTTYYFVKNLDKFTGYIDECADEEGETAVIWVSGALSDGYADLQTFYDMLNDDHRAGKAALIGYSTNSLSEVFAAIELVGAVYNVKEEAHAYIDNIRLKCYAMSMEAKALNKGYTVYMESTSKTGAGTGTIINTIMTEVLGLTNICVHQQWQEIGDEKVIEAAPHVIMFYTTDKRTDDQLMRVGIEISV